MTEKSQKDPMTYAESGVDIDVEGNSIRALLSSLTFRRKGEARAVRGGAGYSGMIDIGDRYLSLCTDGVGSKLRIAETLQRWDTVGIDCIAMNVNDMICSGAEPIAFVDYIATQEPNPKVMEQIGKGLNEGASLSNMDIVGGETATLPDIINGLDLAGTCVGTVDKSGIVDPGTVEAGDIIIGLPSSGIHSNGFTLVRRVIEDNDLSLVSPLDEVISSPSWKNRSSSREYRALVEEWIGYTRDKVLGEVLLTPTRIYVREVMNLLQNVGQNMVHGMAHITGGGIRNLSRLNPALGYEVNNPMDPQPVFRMIQVLGSVAEEEMYQTFNMGMGFAIVVDPEGLDEVFDLLKDRNASVVGRVAEEPGVRIPDLSLDYAGYV